MTLEQQRRARADEAPIVGGLPEVPGILVAMSLAPGLGLHLRGLADELLVKDFAGSTLTRAERELLATAVSAGNDCFFCMDSHASFAREHLERAGAPRADALLDAITCGSAEGLEPKLAALVHVARTVGRAARALTRDDVQRALDAGATDADTQLAVLIAAGFSMYNRLVDGLRAHTPASAEAYRGQAAMIADHGYSGTPGAAAPR